jgi:hypothetical protein
MKKIIFVIFLAILLNSCSSEEASVSIFTNQLCGKSCWNNIEIGLTTEKELLEIIHELPNVEQNSITGYDDSAGSMFDRTISFQYYVDPDEIDSLVTVTIRTINDTVVSMIFQGDLGLKFEDFISQFGEPDIASSFWVIDGGINVNFIYKEMGIELTTYLKSEKTSISPETEINYFFFFDPGMYENFLELDILTPDHQFFILYPWNGFGKIEELYWPPR